jgi:RNase P subunit RPR2
MSRWDQIRPKYCANCKKLFFRGGKKQIKGDMRKAAIAVEYVCDKC